MEIFAGGGEVASRPREIKSVDRVVVFLERKEGFKSGDMEEGDIASAELTLIYASEVARILVLPSRVGLHLDSPRGTLCW